MANLTPGVYVREYDTSTIINTPSNIEKLYEYLDQGFAIHGADGQVVMGKVDGEYIIPDQIRKKIMEGNIPKDEIDHYLDRLGV